MTSRELIDRAATFAEEAHAGQERKYTGEFYFVHPQEVAEIVQSVGGDTEMICAAYLHDVVEDCGIDIGQIVVEFGHDIADLVSDLTDVSKPSDGNRAARKAIDREHTGRASPRAKTIKLADLISNSSTILQHDPNFAKVYLAEKRLLLEVLKAGNKELWARAYKICEEATQTTGEGLS